MKAETTSKHNHGQGSHHGQGPRYCVNTEGTFHDWPQDTITTEEIAELGGWDPALGVIEVDHHNNERTLEPGEVVQLKPGQGFCRRILWKRGLVRAQRISEELVLLREQFPTLDFRDPWIRIPHWHMPSGWNPDTVDVAFIIADSYPAAPPYGIFVPAGLRVNGANPGNYTEPAQTQPPFGGSWGVFSWAVGDQKTWQPGTDVRRGANLLRWVHSFNARFAEGA